MAKRSMRRTMALHEVKSFELGLQCVDCSDIVELNLPLLAGEDETALYRRIGSERYECFSAFMLRHSGHQWLAVALGPEIDVVSERKPIVFSR